MFLLPVGWGSAKQNRHDKEGDRFNGVKELEFVVYGGGLSVSHSLSLFRKQAGEANGPRGSSLRGRELSFVTPEF
jgi:hypothetical protein